MTLDEFWVCHCLLDLIDVVKVVKKYVKRPLIAVSSYILGEDVIESKWLHFCLAQVSACWDNLLSCQRRADFWICAFSLFCAAGRFSLTRKANWRRQIFRMPWRRLLQNTTVSNRQMPLRTKHDGPGKPQPEPKTFLQQHWARNTAGVLISSALNYSS